MGCCFGQSTAPPKKPKTPAQGFKVCVCACTGGIGNPLSMLLALEPLVAELALYDLDTATMPASGVAADLGHFERRCKVKSYVLAKRQPMEELEECFRGCHLVMVPVGAPRSANQERVELLKINAAIVKDIVEACAKFCPEAVVALIVNPMNSIVPAMARLYEIRGCVPTKIIGVTSLDAVRANKFVHEATGVPVESIEVPVVGGHAGRTIVPLFSQDAAAAHLSLEDVRQLEARVQNAGREVVYAKNGKGSATLSMAYAAARLGRAVLQGLAGQPQDECAYVKSSVCELPFFASRVTFSRQGVERVHPLGKLSAYEQERLKEAKELLQTEIDEGLAYADTLKAKESPRQTVVHA